MGLYFISSGSFKGDIVTEELTKTGLLIYELLIDDDTQMLTVLLNRKIKAQMIRKGVAS